MKFIHPNEKGLIVIINGQSELWLKYAEIFYDLYQNGYSVYSYDHRGQGLSPHLAPRNSQIGHVDYFNEYAFDLNEFMETVIKPIHPQSKNLFLIAHSMGGAVAAEYLESFQSPFQAVVLNAPMFRINTKPYPEKIARTIVQVSKMIGLGKRYAIGKHDDHCDRLFENNIVSSSKVRWEINNQLCESNPETVIGGPSSGWVNAALREGKFIRSNASKIKANVLMLQAGLDQLVVNESATKACSKMQSCKLSIFPTSQHEILMEQDVIRDLAFTQMEAFFTGN